MDMEARLSVAGRRRDISHAGVWRRSSLLNSIAGQDDFCFVKQLYKDYLYMVSCCEHVFSCGLFLCQVSRSMARSLLDKRTRCLTGGVTLLSRQ